VHLFRPSLGFLDEAQPRLVNRRGQKALFGHTTFCISGNEHEKENLAAEVLAKSRYIRR
jgi:hypothetical protein